VLFEEVVTPHDHSDAPLFPELVGLEHVFCQELPGRAVFALLTDTFHTPLVVPYGHHPRPKKLVQLLADIEEDLVGPGIGRTEGVGGVQGDVFSNFRVCGKQIGAVAQGLDLGDEFDVVVAAPVDDFPGFGLGDVAPVADLGVVALRGVALLVSAQADGLFFPGPVDFGVSLELDPRSSLPNDLVEFEAGEEVAYVLLEEGNGVAPGAVNVDATEAVLWPVDDRQCPEL